jgi:lipopolysaccharide export LptBFGC system permease protein LptF
MSASTPPADQSPLRRVGVAVLGAMCVGLVVLVVGQGFSSIGASGFDAYSMSGGLVRWA